jgi:hypothetical protein
MFKFHKRVPLYAAQILLERVRQDLEPIAADMEITPERLWFKISGFAPQIPYSRFAAFSQITVSVGKDDYILKLEPTALLLIPFSMACVGYLAFRTMGPISLAATLFIFLMPAAVVLLALCESLARTFLWWRSL